MKKAAPEWNEVFDASGAPRPGYEGIVQALENHGAAERHTLMERLDATLREMGVTFAPKGAPPSWKCELLPQVFTASEWDLIQQATRQRLNAFELFLQDIYGKREILRAGAVPVSPVLGSPHYQTASIGLSRPQGHYLHLSGLGLTRSAEGRLLVKQHFFSRASGISYMMQNRRGLARVAPHLFQHEPVLSLAETPLAIIEHLQQCAASAINEPSVVMLSSGPASPVYSDHGFLARRMGVPLVQGGDLLVLNDCVYLKTVQGLKRVHVIYSRVADAWLDPLVFRHDSLLGVPGLVHCLRKGTVTVVNAIGSQLADDRSLLCYASRIIRFYLGEEALLPTFPTYHLGDLDQRDFVESSPEDYFVRPIFGDDLAATMEHAFRDSDVWKHVRKNPARFIAQPRGPFGVTARSDPNKPRAAHQDFVVFALRSGEQFDVFPGALTRLFSITTPDRPWTSKDTWVLSPSPQAPAALPLPATASPSASTRRRLRRISEPQAQAREVTSRVADAFYWLGRYLERAHHQAYLIQAIETLETEELNSAERKLYRPMWNRLLPPLEAANSSANANENGRRSITTHLDRYRLLLLPQPGSVLSMLKSAIVNAQSIQECLSPEAWSALVYLKSRFERVTYRESVPEPLSTRTTRRLSEIATALIPQFFAISGDSMLADDGWRFCQVGASLERAILTSNALHSISEALAKDSHGTEIELSAFLRLLGSRDAYRRVYQMKAEPIPVLELLWQNPEAPRSVMRCLNRCASLLERSSPPDTAGARRALDALEELKHRIKRIDWSAFLGRSSDEEIALGQLAPSPETASPQPSQPPHRHPLEPLLAGLRAATLDLHHLISDGFLSHQGNIAQAIQPMLGGF
jgi:uncharacterized circularly permuted ATP-grasp superfamily protein/uncharacterized alpha-E superfamily protein